jgi:hypothetical protein
VTDPAVKAAYRGRAETVLTSQTRAADTMTPLPLEELENDFRQELAEAEAWYAELRRRELDWIKSEKNPDEEFAKLYASDPAISARPERHPLLGLHPQSEIILWNLTRAAGAWACWSCSSSRRGCCGNGAGSPA